MKIERAVRLLDEGSYNWEYQVDIDKLDNSSGNRDILGQVFGKSYKGQLALGIDAPRRKELGFDGEEDLWKEIILLKKASKPPVAEQLSLLD